MRKGGGGVTKKEAQRLSNAPRGPRHPPDSLLQTSCRHLTAPHGGQHAKRGQHSKGKGSGKRWVGMLSRASMT